MEYIISSSYAPEGDICEDETYCSRGLCTHPSCWDSHIRQTRGFRKYVSLSDGASVLGQNQQFSETEDEGLSNSFLLLLSLFKIKM
ncbi:hypothetical protein EB796_016609 [Bugula neritina]|uniref:Uncharacterized protein n=1 Tax=Bugula neritina TaxID=10212 RepID=A0A7J7JFI4_BUGNE|nr:hypothetical protein EB796_016609 [Bugula neritina]